jgi:hypothetical protein
MHILNSETLQVLSLIVSFIIPILVGLVTSRVANGTVKSLTLFVLAAVVAVIAEAIDKGSFSTFQAFMLFAQNFLVAVTAHYGVLKPSGVTGTNGVVQRNFAGGLNLGSQTKGPRDKGAVSRNFIWAVIVVVLIVALFVWVF